MNLLKVGFLKRIVKRQKKTCNESYSYPDDYNGKKPLKDPKQELFCQELLKDFNQRKAAERAHYAQGAPSGRTANRLLKYDYVRKRVAFLRDQLREVNEVTTNYIVCGMKELAEGAKYDSDRLGAFIALGKYRAMFVDRKIVEEKPKRIVIRNESGKIEEELREG